MNLGDDRYEVIDVFEYIEAIHLSEAAVGKGQGGGGIEDDIRRDIERPVGAKGAGCPDDGARTKIERARCHVCTTYTWPMTMR